MRKRKKVLKKEEGRQKTVREEVDGLSDEELIDKNFAFGVPTECFPADARIIDEMKKLSEILRRSSKTQTRFNIILIWLTVALLIIGIATIFVMGYQIYLQLFNK